MNIAGEEVAVEHMMPGRIRLRIRSRRGDVDFFKQLVAFLSDVTAVDEIEANPRTGGLLIRHSATPEQLAFLAAQSGLLPAQNFLRTHSGNSTAAGQERLGPPPSLTTIGLFALSLFQALRGRVLASATEHFWQAGRAQARNAPVLSMALFGLGIFQLLSGRVLAPASSLFVYALFRAREDQSGPLPLDVPAPAENGNGNGDG